MRHIKTFSTILLVGLTLGLSAQELDKNKQYEVAGIGFYNLENLFDTLDTDGVRDTEFTPAGEKAYTGKRYHTKLENLSDVISRLGTDVTPDGMAILGVCEIENKSVLEDLVKQPKIADRDYQIVHYDSPDRRGIDVGLLYNPKYFTVTSSRSLRLTIEGDTSFRSRDQLLVTGDLRGEEVHIMVAHWPSRRGGQKRSAPKRNAAAQLGRSVVDSILAVKPDAKIFYMGDLNDDPVNKSVSKYMRGSGNQKRIGDKMMFNPMENFYKQGIGTLAWRDTWNLFDQILMTPEVIHGEYEDWQYFRARVFNKPFLKQKEGKFSGYPMRTYVGSTWMGGYSDHFPVYIFLIREQG